MRGYKEVKERDEKNWRLIKEERVKKRIQREIRKTENWNEREREKERIKGIQIERWE